MKNAYEKDKRQLTLECDCGNVEHILRFEYWADDSDWPEFYVFQALNADMPFFMRLKYAFIYLFRRYPYNSMFGDTMLSPHDVRDALQFLQEYHDHAESRGWYNINEDCDKQN